MRRCLSLLLGCPVFLSLSCAGGHSEPPAAEEQVRSLLQDKEFTEFETVLRMGERAFPAFEAILADPKAKPFEIARVFGILREVKANRSRFLEYTVRGLAHPDSSVRRQAVQLLGQIGTENEASPVVALLSDGAKVADKPIVYYAANTLVAIGGPREVVAMDAWLLGASHRDDAHLRHHVKQCRDKLKKRLDDLVRDPTKEKH